MHVSSKAGILTCVDMRICATCVFRCGCEYVLHVSLSTGILPMSVCMSVLNVYLSMKMYPDDMVTL